MNKRKYVEKIITIPLIFLLYSCPVTPLPPDVPIDTIPIELDEPPTIRKQICRVEFKYSATFIDKADLIEQISYLEERIGCDAENFFCVLFTCDGTYIFKTKDDIPEITLVDSCGNSVIFYTYDN